MNWFASGGRAYAAHRPDYPADLGAAVAALAPAGATAVDLGCGSGQFTRLLAENMAKVIGIDPSADQIAHATPAPNIEYRVAPAEATGLPDGIAGLITAAQAAHWFDFASFYSEVRRIAAPGAALALITYGVVVLDDVLSVRFNRFYRDEIGPHWPPERRHVDEAYARIDFPFPRLPITAADIERRWTLNDFADYLRTWSAVRIAVDSGATTVVDDLITDLAPLWGHGKRTIRWPVTVVAGRIEPDDFESRGTGPDSAGLDPNGPGPAGLDPNGPDSAGSGLAGLDPNGLGTRGAGPSVSSSG